MTAPITRDVSGRPSEPRIPPLDRAEMTETQRTAAGTFASNVLRTLMRRNDLLDAMNPLGLALLASEHTSARDRELVITRVALRTGSPYEWANHAPAALSTGRTEEELRKVADPDATWPDADAALLHAVDDLCADDCVSDATWAALRATREDPEILEFLVLIGYYRLMAGVLNSAGVQPEPGGPAYGEPPVIHRSAAAPVDPSLGGTPEGTWAIVYHHPTGDQDITLVLGTRDGRVTGTATNVAGGVTAEISDGTVDGNRFTATTVLTTPTRLEITYTGAVHGTAITGEVTVKGFGSLPFDGTRVS